MEKTAGKTEKDISKEEQNKNGNKKKETIIGVEEIRKAAEILTKYKNDKSELESRILEEYKWWKMRHWDAIGGDSSESPRPVSAWLFNTIANKHADAMDNFPEPNVLPRCQNDEQDAKTLSAVLPVILERNNFEKTYSRAWDFKLRHGFVPYGIVWDNYGDDGFGDIAVNEIDPLNIFWEKGVSDIQQSRNLFIVSAVDTDILEEEYPEIKGKASEGNSFGIKTYDDDSDFTGKTLVVEWYYKKFSNGKNILHYVKFSGETVLYATENDPELRETGLYEHGKYPIVFDVLYPESGSCVGFGLIAITKSPQLYIDKLDSVLLENAVLCAKPRYFISQSAGVNEEEFLDGSKVLVHVEGSMADDRIKTIEVPSVAAYAMNMLEYKIREMKETSSNNDATSGSSVSGVTSGAAISALQEAGNKQSRDMINASYRVYTEICYFVIELIRQFYDENRTFRITGEGGEAEYVSFNNANLKGSSTGASYIGQPIEEYESLRRKPIFDISVRPQKRSAYSKLSQNSLAQEFYQMGFFNPQLATQSLACIEMMDFDGKEKVKSLISQGATYQKQIEELSAQIAQQNQVISSLTGGQEVPEEVNDISSPNPPSAGVGNKEPELSYGEKIAQRANVSVGE